MWSTYLLSMIRFREINDNDYNSISDILSRELIDNRWVDNIVIRSWCMDECNRRGIKWFGKHNKDVIPNLVQMTIKKAKQLCR